MKYDVTVERTITQEIVFTVEAENHNEAGQMAEKLATKTARFSDIEVTARNHRAVVIAPQSPSCHCVDCQEVRS